MDMARNELTPDEKQMLWSLVREKLDVDSTIAVEDTTQVRELPGVDSMKVFRLLGAIEIGFAVNLGFESIPRAHTVRDIEQLICESRAKRARRTA